MLKEVQSFAQGLPASSRWSWGSDPSPVPRPSFSSLAVSTLVYPAFTHPSVQARGSSDEQAGRALLCSSLDTLGRARATRGKDGGHQSHVRAHHVCTHTHTACSPFDLAQITCVTEKPQEGSSF